MLIRSRAPLLIPAASVLVLALLATGGRVFRRQYAETAQAQSATAAVQPPSRPSRNFSAAAPRLDAWRVLGPGGGGAQYNHAISPLDPLLMLLACDMSGNYISRDGGNTWRMFNLRGFARQFIFDPSNPKVIYALANGIYRSEDAGDTWRSVLPAEGAIRSIAYTDDEAMPLVKTVQGPARVTALAIDPADRNLLYAAQENQFTVSTDYGATWKTLGKIAYGAVLKILVDPTSPRSDRSIYVMTWDRVYVYEHGVWRGNEPIPDTKQALEAAGTFSAEGPILYALIDHRFEGKTSNALGGLMVSRDRGATWKQAHRGILDNLADPWILPVLRAVTVVPDRPNEFYLSYFNLRLKSEPRMAYFGVAHTTDGGATWEYPWKSAAKPPANVRDAWLTERFGTYWGENPLAMALRGNLMIEGDLGRTMRSSDGGKTWDAVYSRRMEDGYASTGLDVTTCYGVHFDPFDPNRLFVSYTDIGLFRSETGGDTWLPSTDGVDRTWVNTTYWMEFDPEVRGRAWAVMSNTHDLPRTRIVRRGTASIKGGVMTSFDGGRSWQKANSGMEESAATHILLDPDSSKDNRTLYVAAMGRGVYRSMDGGRRWELMTSGLPDNPLVWRLALHRGHLYAVVTRRKDNGKFGGPEDGAIYHSTDRGETWSRMELPQGLNGPTGIAFTPADPNRVYVSAWSRTDPVFATNADGGVFVSPDGGKTWANTLTDPNIYDVTVDPSNPDRVYAVGFQSAAWRSDDRGQSWRRLRGFNFKGGHRVIPDPRSRDKIFITTFGGSVWHGPADGDPKAVEDIVTPAASFSRAR